MLGAVETDDDQHGSQHDKDHCPRIDAHVAGVVEGDALGDGEGETDGEADGDVLGVAVTVTVAVGVGVGDAPEPAHVMESVSLPAEPVAVRRQSSVVPLNFSVNACGMDTMDTGYVPAGHGAWFQS
jgi:hypothetical protein